MPDYRQKIGGLLGGSSLADDEQSLIGKQALLATGLGILANNRGSSPQQALQNAIGKGGLLGLQSGMGSAQNIIDNRQRGQLFDLQKRRFDRQERMDQIDEETRLAMQGLFGADGNIDEAKFQALANRDPLLAAKVRDAILNPGGSAPAEQQLMEYFRSAGQLSPEEYNQAIRVRLGLEGRASSAGQQSIEVKGQDGKTRRLTFDPQTGQYFVAAIDGIPVQGGVPGEQPGAQAVPGASGVDIFTSRPEEESAGAIERAKQEAKADVEKSGQENQLGSKLTAQMAKTARLDDTIDKALGMVDYTTSGVIGGRLSGIYQPARDLAATIDTIKANIGFDALQEMRDNSPTGGALGQVSEMENRLLQSLIANLEQSQSPEQLRENLEIVRREVKASWQRVRDAFQKDYGYVPEGMGPGPAQPSGAQNVRRYNPQTGQFE